VDVGHIHASFKLVVDSVGDGGTLRSVTADVGLLVGRDREIDAIELPLDGVGGPQTALIIRGEPEIGKSALLSEASRRANARGMLVRTLLRREATDAARIRGPNP
jgi:hypothetical protein